MKNIKIKELERKDRLYFAFKYALAIPYSYGKTETFRQIVQYCREHLGQENTDFIIVFLWAILCGGLKIAISLCI